MDRSSTRTISETLTFGEDPTASSLAGLEGIPLTAAGLLWIPLTAAGLLWIPQSGALSVDDPESGSLTWYPVAPGTDPVGQPEVKISPMSVDDRSWYVAASGEIVVADPLAARAG